MKAISLEKICAGETLTLREQIRLVIRLSVPAILAQISTIVMEYIDASMVGSLGADASASIGIVSTTTWLIGGLCSAVGTGFTVGIAHRMGAGKTEEARKCVQTGLITVVMFASILMLAVVLIHKQLPVWMGGDAALQENAASYFLIFGLTLPLMQINYTGAGMLECSGNMKIPSVINMALCVLDILFNAFFIYENKSIVLFGETLTLPGAGLGVRGAALGTMCAQFCGAAAILLALLFSHPLAVWHKSIPDCMEDIPDHLQRNFMNRTQWLSALRMSLPVMLSSLIMGSAYVLSTRIVAPLGSVAISANSFSITAESLCYMPGYGIAHAATTLVGQAKGAGNSIYTRRFSLLTTAIGIAIMAMTAVLLYLFAPEMIAIMSPDTRVRELGTRILRIEAFAEPMFGASIVTEGILRGLGKTGIPSALNLASMWCVRLPLSALAAASFGLVGVWYVMCAELCFRGVIFLIAQVRVLRKH